MNDVIDQAYADLAELRTRFSDLDEALVPGTPRRAVSRDLTPGERRRLDLQAREDRETKEVNLVRGIAASGYSAAPFRAEVFDARVAIEHGVFTLDSEVAERLGLTQEWGSVAETITRLIGRLNLVATDAGLAARVRNEARRMNRLAGRALGEQEPVVRIDGRCPHCDAKSLRAFPDRELVMCISGACQCEDDECGCRRRTVARFHHEWSFAEWPGLAAKLGAA
jgi:hypothetical protein